MSVQICFIKSNSPYLSLLLQVQLSHLDFPLQNSLEFSLALLNQRRNIKNVPDFNFYSGLKNLPSEFVIEYEGRLNASAQLEEKGE